jgi:hypothetical protein
MTAGGRPKLNSFVLTLFLPPTARAGNGATTAALTAAVVAATLPRKARLESDAVIFIENASPPTANKVKTANETYEIMVDDQQLGCVQSVVQSSEILIHKSILKVSEAQGIAQQEAICTAVYTCKCTLLQLYNCTEEYDIDFCVFAILALHVTGKEGNTYLADIHFRVCKN